MRIAGAWSKILLSRNWSFSLSQTFLHGFIYCQTPGKRLQNRYRIKSSSWFFAFVLEWYSFVIIDQNLTNKIRLIHVDESNSCAVWRSEAQRQSVASFWSSWKAQSSCDVRISVRVYTRNTTVCVCVCVCVCAATASLNNRAIYRQYIQFYLIPDQP